MNSEIAPKVPASPRVSVILVSYNTRELVRRALLGLREDPAVAEIWVVDNASADETAAMVGAEFPDVNLIANSVNRGFGRANNQALDRATGDLVLLLNSDAVPTPGAIARLAEVFTEASVAAAGGRLTFPDGRLQESACASLTLWAIFCEQLWLEKAFPRSRWLSPYWQSGRLSTQGSGPHQVEQVMGACLMMRPGLRFDERFFLYVEDTELCHRLRSRGQILYVPEAIFVHDLGASSSGTRWESVARYNRGKELYMSIHRGRFAAFLAWGLNRLGALLRLLVYALMALATLGRRGRESVRLWSRVLTAPRLGPPDPPGSA